jgi:UDP-4-amino-4-deoxy-L-arabinose-oxoglutarate aminotransferase
VRAEFLPVARPSITDLEVAAVEKALRSGWLTSGPQTAAFEEEFAGAVGAKHAVAVASATAGFFLVLQALGLQEGDEVVTASLTWPSPVNAIYLSGARPVFADIHPDTLQLDIDSVEAVLTPRTRAIMPVHFAGQPVDLDRLGDLCSARGILLIEDAAHAIGTEYRGRPIGERDNPAVFSFHAIKNVTCGEGGMITTGDAALAQRLRRLRFHGIDQDAWKRHGKEAASYDLIEPSGKHNLTDLQAALGRAQLQRLDELQASRLRLATLYESLLDQVPELSRPVRVPYPSKHAWHLYTVFVDSERAGLGRDQFRAELRRRNIGTGLHFLAVHELSYYREKLPQPPGVLRHSEWVSASIVTLPLFADMQEGDVGDVVEAIRDVFSARAS